MPVAKLALPLRLENGSLATVAQDTLDDIAKCCETVVRYPLEHLPFLPDFGTPPMVFHQATENFGQEITDALAEWESRATTGVAADQLDLEGLVRGVQVSVTSRPGTA